MMLTFKVLLSLLASYLLGSIPTAYIVGRIYKGIDIRRHGSGNVGATNAFRVLGKFPGSIVFLIDVLKGVAATTLVADMFGINHIGLRVLLGVFVVVGHNWTILLQFKGGKGIATSLGVLIGLTLKIAILRPVLLITLFVWLSTFLITGFISLASIGSAVVLPFLMVYFCPSIEMVLLAVVFCVFVVFRHRPNIKRLLSGKEPRLNSPFVLRSKRK